MKKLAGFTLTELLVTMGILGVVLLAASQYFVQTTQVTSSAISSATLQEELRNAGNIITDEVQRAVYVFPPCGVYSSVDLPTPILKPGCVSFDPPSTISSKRMNVSWSRIQMSSTGNRSKRPDDGTYLWEVGVPTAPILAMIVAPFQSYTPCDRGTGTNDGGCYQFVAYFAVKRAQVTRGLSGNSTTSKDLLDANPSEDNQWVIMEYRRRLDQNLFTNAAPLNANVALPGYGTMNAGIISGIPGAGTAAISPIRWRDAGCTFDSINVPNTTGAVFTNQSDWICTEISSSVKYNAPTSDPVSANQSSPNSLPAVAKGNVNPADLANFAARMLSTVTWLNSNREPGNGRILVENIRPNTGFSIEYTANSVDERGVSAVRLRLQGEVNRGGSPVVFPPQPLEYFASPRNIAP
jgi:prepilin-type N-terminal cleavage/methylation domain-containing protein